MVPFETQWERSPPWRLDPPRRRRRRRRRSAAGPGLPYCPTLLYPCDPFLDPASCTLYPVLCALLLLSLVRHDSDLFCCYFFLPFVYPFYLFVYHFISSLITFPFCFSVDLHL